MRHCDHERMEAFIGIIKEHQGAEKAITSGEIARMMNIVDGSGNPTTRRLIRRCMEQHNLPVGACDYGYYWMIRPEELKQYLATLQGRIDAIASRMEAVERNYHAFVRDTVA